MRASIHSLDHYALAVPDLAAAAAFYRSFGLEARPADGGFDLFTAGGGWKPRQVTPDNGFYLWGPQPPEDFAHNYESPSAPT